MHLHTKHSLYCIGVCIHYLNIYIPTQTSMHPVLIRRAFRTSRHRHYHTDMSPPAILFDSFPCLPVSWPLRLLTHVCGVMMIARDKNLASNDRQRRIRRCRKEILGHLGPHDAKTICLDAWVFRPSPFPLPAACSLSPSRLPRA